MTAIPPNSVLAQFIPSDVKRDCAKSGKVAPQRDRIIELPALTDAALWKEPMLKRESRDQERREEIRQKGREHNLLWQISVNQEVDQLLENCQQPKPSKQTRQHRNDPVDVCTIT